MPYRREYERVYEQVLRKVTEDAPCPCGGQNKSCNICFGSGHGLQEIKKLEHDYVYKPVDIWFEDGDETSSPIEDGDEASSPIMEDEII